MIKTFPILRSKYSRLKADFNHPRCLLTDLFALFPSTVWKDSFRREPIFFCGCLRNYGLISMWAARQCLACVCVCVCVCVCWVSKRWWCVEHHNEPHSITGGSCVRVGLPEGEGHPVVTNRAESRDLYRTGGDLSTVALSYTMCCLQAGMNSARWKSQGYALEGYFHFVKSMEKKRYNYCPVVLRLHQPVQFKSKDIFFTPTLEESLTILTHYCISHYIVRIVYIISVQENSACIIP